MTLPSNYQHIDRHMTMYRFYLSFYMETHIRIPELGDHYKVTKRTNSARAKNPKLTINKEEHSYGESPMHKKYTNNKVKY